MITRDEIVLVHQVLEYSMKAGATAARATLNKSSENLVSTLDGCIDKVTRCEDRSMSIALFSEGKYGSFSTNKLDIDALHSFIDKAIGIVKMLSADHCRHLPSPVKYCMDAITGKENGIYDDTVGQISSEDRCRLALDAAVFGSDPAIISEEGEYSDSVYDIYLADTQGLECRHTETSFDYGVEITVQDRNGDKYSGYWWHAAPFAKDLRAAGCGQEALRRALGQIGSTAAAGGKYNMIVESDVASKMVSPLLNALNAYSIQQNNSFLAGTLGRKVFPEGLTVIDMPRIKGETGSKRFDSEGVNLEEAPIIENGVVKRYFINTYMSEKLHMEPTAEEAARPKVSAWPTEGLSRDDIMRMCGDGILVTDFNGGNCNAATGNFSYGIEGYLIRDGKPACPVSGMLVTGNFIDLWSNLIAAGSDARSCMSKLIPTLAFSNVDFSGE